MEQLVSVADDVTDRSRAPALCVDLDGTLLASDVLWESVLLLLRERPWLAAALPLWLFHGKAVLKQRVAEAVSLDVTRLPYRAEVMHFLAEESRTGRPIVLATATDASVAHRIAEHLGLFTEVAASDGRVNLSGVRKAEWLTNRFGAGKFDYLGNDHVDIPAWRAGRHAIVVAPAPGLLRRIRGTVEVHRLMAPQTGSLRPMLRVMRPQQWVKNLLLFIPLVTSHRLLEVPLLALTLAAFVAFSLSASAVYILNDLLDIQNDRLHPRKRFRPFAAGDLPVSRGVMLVPALLAAAAAVTATCLPSSFALLLAGYLVTTTAYSFDLKKRPIIDVLVLAGLYALRVLAGGLATGITISEWLLPFALFLFLSLALMKRFSEIRRAPAGVEALSGRGYRTEDASWLQSAGLCSAYMAVLVLALYIRSDDVTALYRTPQFLWGFCLVVLYWVTRLWFRAHRGLIEDDPVVVAVSDPVSYAVAGVGGLLLLAAI